MTGPRLTALAAYDAKTPSPRRSGPCPATSPPTSSSASPRRSRPTPPHGCCRTPSTTTSVDDIALDRRVVTSIDHSVSHLLDDWAVTSQEKSGRCWLFAGTNLLRAGAREKLAVKDFEFSQNHLLFWDKFEKANHWLESIIATADRDVDDRTVAHLLATPAEDGGQWNMFVALVVKHGLVPKVAMPETKSSSNTAPMNRDLSTILRQAARDLRAQAADGAAAEDLRDDQGAGPRGDPPSPLHPPRHAAGVVRLAVEGHRRRLPPRRRDDAARVRASATSPCRSRTTSASSTTPARPARTAAPSPSSTSATSSARPPVTYLNVESDLMKSLAAQAIAGGEPVWFGCDTGQMSNADLGLWDAALYDHASIYGTEPSLGKADRLLHHESLMTHAMLFTGVDLHRRRAAALARREQLGHREGRQGLHDDERLVVRRVRLRGRRTPRRPACRAAGGADSRTRSCSRPGTRWARSPTDVRRLRCKA